MVETTPIEPAPEPRTEGFEEVSDLPDEPQSDVEIQTDSGMSLRERVKRVDSPHGISLVFTYTRLDADGNVETNDKGQPLISDPHEILVSNEDSIRVGADELAASLLHGREVAVARAVDFFTGVDTLPGTLSAIFGSRV